MLLCTLDRKTSSLAVCIIFDLLILSFSPSSFSWCVLCHHMLITWLKCWVDLVSRRWSHRAGNNDDLIWNFDWQWAYNEIRVRSGKDWVLVEDALSSDFDDFTFLLFPFYFRIKISCSLFFAPSPPCIRGSSFLLSHAKNVCFAVAWWWSTGLFLLAWAWPFREGLLHDFDSS